MSADKIYIDKTTAKHLIELLGKIEPKFYINVIGILIGALTFASYNGYFYMSGIEKEITKYINKENDKE